MQAPPPLDWDIPPQKVARQGGTAVEHPGHKRSVRSDVEVPEVAVLTKLLALLTDGTYKYSFWIQSITVLADYILANL